MSYTKNLTTSLGNNICIYWLQWEVFCCGKDATISEWSLVAALRKRNGRNDKHEAEVLEAKLRETEKHYALRT